MFRTACPGLSRVLLFAMVVAACDGAIVAPAPEADAALPERPVVPPGLADGTAVLEWNALARERVASHATSPPVASRVYALLSVAQHETLQALHGNGGGPPHDATAAVAAASATVLTTLYPQDAALIATRAQQIPGVASHPRGGSAGAVALGERIATEVLERARSDGSDAEWTGTVPTGPGMWYSSAEPPVPPLVPHWGQVRPWLMASGDQFRPPAPPAFGSAAFLDALAEVRHYSDHRTADQLRIALLWADGPGTVTPPGHWNAIAVDLIRAHRMDGRAAARVLAYLNMAIMDAGISCWDAKYAWWLIRPSQADPSITTPVGLPNFPSYTSGHATFSGAAAAVLGHFFPGQRRELEAMAEEAAVSRLYGGIHYRFDSDLGLAAGRAIGGLAIAAARRDRR